MGNESWGGFIGFNLKKLKDKGLKDVVEIEFFGVFRRLNKPIAYSHILLIYTHFN